MSIAAMQLALDALYDVLDDAGSVQDLAVSGGMYEGIIVKNAIAALETAISAAALQQLSDVQQDMEQAAAPQQWQGLTADEAAGLWVRDCEC